MKKFDILIGDSLFATVYRYEDAVYLANFLKEKVFQIRPVASSDGIENIEVKIEDGQSMQNKNPSNRWANYDYTKNAMPEGVTVERANVFKKNNGKYAVTAIINGERRAWTTPSPMMSWPSSRKTRTAIRLVV